MTTVEFWIAGGGLMTLMFGSFGVFWKIIVDTKKSAHSRIDRVEEAFNKMEQGCLERLATYVNKTDVEKVEHRLENLDKDIVSSVNEGIIIIQTCILIIIFNTFSLSIFLTFLYFHVINMCIYMHFFFDMEVTK